MEIAGTIYKYIPYINKGTVHEHCSGLYTMLSNLNVSIPLQLEKNTANTEQACINISRSY